MTAELCVCVWVVTSPQIVSAHSLHGYFLNYQGSGFIVLSLV